MKPAKQPDYAIVSVKLEKPILLNAKIVDSQKERFEDIKKSLGLCAPVINEDYGLVPVRLDNGTFVEGVVLIEQEAALKLQASGHPLIVGVFSNSPIAPFQKQEKPISKGPRP